jgi:predicted ATPase/DNA-binding CsgD family transcriptional regulator
MALDINLDETTREATDLPLPLTSFVGREQEIVAVRTLLLHEEVRLLTLTGPGGVGKTRLAQHIATNVMHAFGDGVTFLSLDPLQNAELVLASIAQSLRLQASGTSSLLEQVQACVRDRHLLLVLDNFEHVIAAAPSLVKLLTACPRLKLLVTSREVLHVRGEHEFVVSPLSLPDELHALDAQMAARFGAVALFIERAREACPAFQLTNENASLIVKICQHLDGLPLAIELAAARLKLLSLQALLDRLKHRLQVLTGGPRDLPARQHTLRNTLAWSYDLLSQEEQRLFRLLSAFTGGCTLQAVEAVYGLLGGKSELVMDAITSLMGKHLLYQSVQEYGEPRLQMLSTTREYGWECLCQCGEEEQAQSAHASYYLHLAEEAEKHMYEEQQTYWFDLLAQEQGNLQTALRWAMAHAEEERYLEITLRLAAAARWWFVTTELSLWEPALARSRGIAISVRAKALQAAGCIAFLQDHAVLSEALFKACVKLCHQAGEQHGRALALTWLGWLTWIVKGKDHAARSLLEKCREWARDQKDAEVLICANFGLGCIALDQGNSPEARSRLEESLTIVRAEGNKKYQIWVLRTLGRALFALDDQAGAFALVEESIGLARELHDQLCLAGSLDLLGRMTLALGDTTTARSLIEEGLALSQKLGRGRNSAYSYVHLAYVARQQGELKTAWTCYQKSLMFFQQVGDTRGLASCLREWGVLIATQGEPVWAVRLWGAADALSEIRGCSPFSLPVEWLAYEGKEYERIRRMLRAQLGEKAFSQAWAEGQTMTPEQALAAQGHPLTADRSSPTSKSEVRTNSHKSNALPALNGLTRREKEVLHLVAQGLTDAQVAETLVVSPRTVHAHLRSIYSKLDLPSRYAAIRYALDHQLF